MLIRQAIVSVDSGGWEHTVEAALWKPQRLASATEVVMVLAKADSSTNIAIFGGMSE